MFIVTQGKPSDCKKYEVLEGGTSGAWSGFSMAFLPLGDFFRVDAEESARISRLVE